MQRSAKALVLLFALALGACGATRKDTGSTPPTVAGQSKPGQATTSAGTPSKPAPKRPEDKGDPQKRYDAALGQMRAGQMSEAEEAFRSLSTDFPQFSGPWTNLGIIYAKSNRRDAALAALSRAVVINRRNAIAHNWLGILYRDARDFQRAERSYKTALELQPNYGLAHLNLGILYDEYLKRPAEALPHFQSYRQFGGQDDLRVLAWIAQIEADRKAAAAPATPVPAAAEARP